MAQEIPREWCGKWEHGLNGEYWVANFNATIPTFDGHTSNFIGSATNYSSQNVIDWYTNRPMIDVVRGCSGVCTAKVRAPALHAVGCRSIFIPTNYTEPVNTEAIVQQETIGPLSTLIFFSSAALQVDQEKEKVVVVTGFAKVVNDSCAGTLNLTTCTYESAIGEHDVQINDNTTTLLPGRPKMIALANNTQIDHFEEASGQHRSTLGNIVNTLTMNLGSAIWNIEYQGIISSRIMGVVPWTNQFMEMTVGAPCNSYSDPRDAYMEKLDLAMFSSGAYAAKEHPSLESQMDPGLPINTTIAGISHKTYNIFHSNLWWWLAAALVELTCIAVVLPTYVGWWKLGRPVSFSPLEIAKAFEAPILSDCDSNASGRELATAVGSGLQVKYGAKGQKFAFAPTASVTAPQRGMRYGV